MDTVQLMRVALELVDFKTVPEDSAIYMAGGGIERVLFGLDIGVGELMMARHLGYDCVIAHHPVGVPHRAWRVFERHVGFMVDAGVPEAAAREAVEPKMEALRLRGQAHNYEQVSQAARRLNLPFLNIHCPLDEMGRRVMQTKTDATLTAHPEATLGDLVNALSGLPAARRGETDFTVPLGERTARAGTTAVAHGALTNGGYHVARAYFEHGVDTVVYIHVSSADVRRLREHEEGQLIVTGHVVGDAFGIAPYVDALRENGIVVDVLSEVLAPGGESW